MTADQPRGFMLWIDGVGSWLACLKPEVTIGGPTLESEAADLSLMADLSRRHATISREDDTWFIEPHAETQLGEHTISKRTQLNADHQLTFGKRVELGFRMPTALSATAVLTFESDHRPARTVDGVVLVHENCLLGPGSENHIICPHWPDSLVLFRRDRQWWCKSRMGLAVDGEIVTDAHQIGAGSVITGEELRLRIEAV